MISHSVAAVCARAHCLYTSGKSYQLRYSTTTKDAFYSLRNQFSHNTKLLTNILWLEYVPRREIGLKTWNKCFCLKIRCIPIKNCWALNILCSDRCSLRIRILFQVWNRHFFLVLLANSRKIENQLHINLLRNDIGN